MRVARFSFVLAGFFLCGTLIAAERTAYNEIAVDVPTDGGGTLMFTRMIRFNPNLDVGLTAGGGFVNRDLEEKESFSGQEVDVKIQSKMFPYVGPRITFNANIIGLTLAYGVFYASSEMEADTPSGTIRGKKSGWGTAFYSPLLMLDFYSKKYDLVFGVGLGGFLGTSFGDITAESSAAKVTTDAHPLNSLTLQVRTRWYDGRKKRMERRDTLDE